MSVTIRTPRERDFFDWLGLYAGYTEFYETELTDEKALILWSWLSDADNDQRALVAVDDDGELVGLAHYRRFPHPIRGDHGVFLDDLFVDPAARRRGIGTELIEAVRERAAEGGASAVRWITAPDNEAARALYDHVAAPTEWVTYEMTV